MRHFMLFLASLCALLLPLQAQEEKPYVAGEVLMKFRSPETHKFRTVDGEIVSGIAPLDQYLQAVGVRRFSEIFSPASDLRGHYTLTFGKEADVERISKTLRLLGAIEYATLNYVAHPSSDPNDPLWPQQWQAVKQQFREAWNITRGISSVLVGIMDTGLVALLVIDEQTGTFGNNEAIVCDQAIVL